MNQPMMILSVGDQIQCGEYYLHSRYAMCLNLQDQDKLIACTHQLSQAGPIQIIVQGIDLTRIERIVIQDRQMRLNQEDWLPIADDVVFDSGVALPAGVVERMKPNLDLADAALLNFAPEKSLAFIFDRRRSRHFTSAFETAFCKHVLTGVETMLQGDVLGGLCSLKGVGFGLTPGGDDFIAGFLLGLSLLQQSYQSDLTALRAIIYARARNSNLVSNTFLSLASQGRFSGKLKNLVGALLERDPSQVIPALQQVLAIGSTSGADLLCGLFFALQTLKDQLIFSSVGAGYV